MTLLLCAVRTTVIFQLVLACYLLDVAYSQLPLQGRHGDLCIYDATNLRSNCTVNAHCNQEGVCLCDDNFSRKRDGTCGVKVGTTGDCQKFGCVDNANCTSSSTSKQPDELNTSSPTISTATPSTTPSTTPGTTPSTTASTAAPAPPALTDPTCVCDDDHYPQNGLCQARLRAGANCSEPEDVCARNSHCNQTTTQCECGLGFYQDERRLCQNRIQLGSSCETTFDGESPCIVGAICTTNHTCQCIDHQYIRIQYECKKITHVGEECKQQQPALTQCEEFAHCNGTMCTCDSDYFYNNTGLYCQKRKPLGAVCKDRDECVAHATCDDVCRCDNDHYFQNGRCNPRLQLDQQCEESVSNQCLVNGKCLNEHCVCDEFSFNNQGINCQPSIPFGIHCNLDLDDPNQCVSNTTCVFMEAALPACGCDLNHFFNGQYCVKRAVAGESCPYALSNSMGLSISSSEFAKQCVQNAYCNTLFQVCACDSGHYDRNGHCPHQIPVGEACDPWTNYPHQCTGTSQCVHGRCVNLH